MTKDPALRVIKKYKNRRLYDLTTSRYITMDDLQTYVLEHRDFQVIDASTGQDLTTTTLLQLFVELESSEFLSPYILRQLIILSQHPLRQQYKILFEKMLAGIPQKTTAWWIQHNAEWLKSWQDFLGEGR